MSAQLPSVGRIVHYYGKLYGQLVGARADAGPFAALVVDVGPGPDVVTLKITDRNGVDYVRANVPYHDADRTVGESHSFWCWPTRVP